MLGMSKVFKDAGSSVMVDTLQRGQWSSNDLFSSPYHSLQAYVVHSTGVLVPHGDAADQDALDRVCGIFGSVPNFHSLLRKYSHC